MISILTTSLMDSVAWIDEMMAYLQSIDFQGLYDSVERFFQQPIPVIGFSVGTILMAFLSILKNTSFGAKNIAMFKRLYGENVEQIGKSREEYDALMAEFDAYKASKEDEIARLTASYDAKLAGVEQDFEKVQGLTLQVASSIPNKNVRSAVRAYEPIEERPISEIVEEAKRSQIEIYKSQIEGYKEAMDGMIEEFRRIAEDVKAVKAALSLEKAPVEGESAKDGESSIQEGETPSAPVSEGVSADGD